VSIYHLSSVIYHLIIEEQKKGQRMTTKARKLESTKKKKYQKPEYQIAKHMTFMFDALKKKPSKIACRQCSGCHGCR